MPHIRPLAQSSRCVLSDSEGTDLFSPPMGLVGGGPYGNALKDEIGEQAVFFFFFALVWIPLADLCTQAIPVPGEAPSRITDVGGSQVFIPARQWEMNGVKAIRPFFGLFA